MASTIICDTYYVDAFGQYLHRKHRDGRGWRAKHGRYFDISKLQYLDISELSVEYLTLLVV